jgi:hypothetical protein
MDPSRGRGRGGEGTAMTPPARPEGRARDAAARGAGSGRETAQAGRAALDRRAVRLDEVTYSPWAPRKRGRPGSKPRLRGQRPIHFRRRSGRRGAAGGGGSWRRRVRGARPRRRGEAAGLVC